MLATQATLSRKRCTMYVSRSVDLNITLSWQLNMTTWLQPCSQTLSPCPRDQNRMTSRNHGGSHSLTTMEVKERTWFWDWRNWWKNSVTSTWPKHLQGALTIWMEFSVVFLWTNGTALFFFHKENKINIFLEKTATISSVWLLQHPFSLDVVQSKARWKPESGK